MSTELEFEPARRRLEASDLVRMLRSKHSEDVFIPECKDGPTLTGSHFRLDAWVMQKSWSHPTTTGYECKVTRNDFLRDEKWQAYLELCSDFYFVCPWGLIQPEEVGAPAGLYWASREGERLFIKKKAVRRPTQIPETMWRYIVMRLDNPRWETTAEKWKRWLAQKEADLMIGHNCGKRLRKEISEQVNRAHAENEKLRAENEKLTEVKAVLADLKVSLHGWRVESEVREQVKRIQQVIPADLIRDLQWVVDKGSACLKTIKGENSSSLT